jgi:hypothetical protein
LGAAGTYSEFAAVDAVGVVSFFNGLADRIADATGLQVEEGRMMSSVQMVLDGSTNILQSASSPITQGLVCPAE